MAIYKNTPPLSTNGLLLYNDFGSAISYPRSGNTVFNLMNTTALTGSFFNNPIFINREGGSSLNFVSNSLHYVGYGNPSSLQIVSGSIGVLAFITDRNVDYGINSGYHGLVVKGSAYSIFVYSNRLGFYDWGNGTLRDSGITIGDNSWKYITMNFTDISGTPSNNATFYINGIPVWRTTVRLQSQTVQLALGWNPGGTDQYFSGQIANFHLYNRVLSEQEIQQNYNALKSRFNLS